MQVSRRAISPQPNRSVKPNDALRFFEGFCIDFSNFDGALIAKRFATQAAIPTSTRRCGKRHHHCPADTRAHAMSPAAKAILAITGLITTSCMFMLASCARTSEKKHLLSQGARVDGKVISVRRESNRAGMPMILRYRFTPEGRSDQVEGQCLVSIFSPYKPGDVAVVCYNKALPSSSIILSPKGKPL